MENQHDRGIIDLFWVYVVRLRKADAYRIGLSVDIDATAALSLPDSELVYVKRFSALDEAIGHKLLLESVSLASLRRLIFRRKWSLRKHRQQ